MQRRSRGGGVVLVLAVLSVAAAERAGTLLIDAVKQGDANAVWALMQRGVDVNATEPDGTTALHWAVYRNDLRTVDQLLGAGANVNLVNRFGVAPLSMAPETGNAEIIERLLKAGGDPNTVKPGEETVLMTAARAGNVDVLKVLLTHGAKPNAQESTRDQTALMWAASEGHTAAVEVLIEAGANLKARSSELKVFHENAFVAGRKGSDSRERLPMFTPLMFAVLGGHIDTVSALLDAGADVNDATPNGTPALHIACINAHWELGIMLLERGADPHMESPGGTALHQIALARAAKTLVKYGGLPPPESTGTKTAMDLVKALVVHGPDVNARITAPGQYVYGTPSRTRAGLTPLMLTTIPADPEYMQTLLALGADPAMTAKDGTTVLMMAAGIGLNTLLGDDEEALDNVKRLVELGVDINAQNDAGDAALHGAAFRNSIPLLQYLVDHGAQIDLENQVGWTPLMEAAGTARNGLFNTRREAEAFFKKLYAQRGLPIVVPTREEAIEKLVYSKGGPVIRCPDGLTVHSEDARPTVINYREATASDRRGYRSFPAMCTPASGSEFPVGTTLVTCTATDANNRTDSCTVLMKVVP